MQNAKRVVPRLAREYDLRDLIKGIHQNNLHKEIWLENVAVTLNARALLK